MHTGNVMRGTLRDNLPQRAGKAEIYWAPGTGLPKRDGKVITIYRRPDFEFYPLKDGEQFLFSSSNTVFFGGTDENPFLTRLRPRNQSLLEVVATQGEQWFYNDYLKPARIKFQEAIVGKPTKRQGDIFAVPLFDNQAEVKPSEPVFWGQRTRVESGQIRLFGTRHLLTGKYTIATNPLAVGLNEYWATGVIEAPDHSPLRLERIHIICQVEVLESAQEAD